MSDRYRLYQILLSGFLVVATAAIVAVELRAPGFCPTYPFLNVPACYVMGCLFFWMFISNFLESSKLQVVVLISSALVALASSAFFSTQQVLGTGQCPTAFGIPLPLCFTVPPVLILCMYLKVLGMRAAESRQ